MAELNREQFLTRIRERLEGDQSDDALAFLEDMTDTFDGISSRNSDGENWRQKYEQLDSDWRARYTARFYDGDPAPQQDPAPEPAKGVNTEIQIDDLFG